MWTTTWSYELVALNIFQESVKLISLTVLSTTTSRTVLFE